MTGSSAGTDQRMIYMRFQPMWAYIDGVRELCRFLCARTFADSTVAERVQLASQELLENAVKYSAEVDARDVELEIIREPEHIVVGVLNHAIPAATRLLEAELARLRVMAPEAAYLWAFERVAEADIGSNRMGLARIRHEGGFSLDMTYADDGRICIAARGKL
jgi:hypothetical protein